MTQRVYRVQPYLQDKAVRSTDYQLLPINPIPPAIISQPLRGFFQVTWLDDSGRQKQVTPTTNTIQLVEGTEFGIVVNVADPANLKNINDDVNLTYVWKKDGTPLYEINSQNNNKGIRGIYISKENSVKDLSGIYTVEITNQYGTTTSSELNILIFRYLDYPLFYKNLIINGNGDEGLDGWNTSNGIRVDGYLEGLLETNNFGSFNVKLDQPLSPTDEPYVQNIFHFPRGVNWSNFPGVYQRINTQNNVDNIGFRWARSYPASLILNEKKESTTLASFFPDPSWIDLFNNNTGQRVINLQAELEDSNAYFTRDSINFAKFGGESTARATQLIDLTEMADMIDGNVYGVDQVVGQFFAYIGAGLSRYKFKVPYQTGVIQTNWYILDNKVYSLIGEDFATRGAASVFYPEGGLDETKPVELIPIVDDTTSIFIKYLDDNGIILSERRINGPTAEDVFAVKEKFYTPKFLELPITKGIPYKDINVTYEFDFQNTKTLLKNWADNEDLYGIRENAFKPISAAISLGINPKRLADTIVNILDNISTYREYPFVDPDVVERVIQGIRTLIIGTLSVIAPPAAIILELVLKNTYNRLLNLLRTGPNVGGNISVPNPTKVDDDVFYNIHYPIFANLLRISIISLDQDLADEDTKNELEGNPLNFQYLINQRFRLQEYITWYQNYLTNSNAYKNKIDKNERERVEQSFKVFEQFLRFIQEGKRRVETNNRYKNNVTVFGQPYSTVDAIANSDFNIKWINEKINKLSSGVTETTYKLNSDPGASAFFAINDNQVIPRGTRQVEITFEFNHSSEAYIDQSPETKDWSSSELYIDLFGSEVSAEGEKKYVKLSYGAPRCAITSMKYALFPNRVTVDGRYNSYLIPEQNVWYVEKTKLEQNIHNSANGLVFNYTTVDNIKPLPTSQPFTQDQINRDVEQPG